MTGLRFAVILNEVKDLRISQGIGVSRKGNRMHAAATIPNPYSLIPIP